ncbi:hypothetical protein, partial [Limnospira sp. PMC 1298.21]|uniref:hypothetical protein n=1 Tax=Limnospira sp. PMC 1298.21 TaxID=2981081 RepID=UPI0028E0AD5F
HGGHLLSIGKLYTGFDKHLINVLRSKLALEELILEDVRIHLIRKDDAFNFTHIIEYFGGNRKKESTGGTFDLSVDRIRMSNIAFKLDNLDTELYFTTLVESIDLKVKQLDINELLFDMERIHLFRPYVHLMRKERLFHHTDTT